MLCRLVAHHSCAIIEASERGLADVLISADTRARLGSAGITEVTASLWRVDCQSCGLPLGAAPTVLAVDQAGPAGWASLHHERCREPEWNSSGVIAVNAAYQTHRSRLVMMPVHGLHLAAERDQVLPVIIVNPARPWSAYNFARPTDSGSRSSMRISPERE
jgi:hypothetical protein